MAGKKLTSAQATSAAGGGKSGIRERKAVEAKLAKAAQKAKEPTKPKAKKAKKVKVSHRKILAESTSRITWNPQPVEGSRWFVIQTASNYEKRVQMLIREQILLQGMQKSVEDVLIP